MSDQTKPDPRSGTGGPPDDRAPPPWTLSKTTTVGAAGAGIGLAVHYTTMCMAAGHLVAPTQDQLWYIAGLFAVPVHLVFRVFNFKLQKWAAAQGVQS